MGTIHTLLLGTFNDGEACVFSANEPRVKFVGGKEDAGDYEDGFIDTWSLSYKDDSGNYPYRDSDAPDVSDDTFDAIAGFNKLLQSGAYDLVLQKTFGDPAQVTATKEGFDVEYYEHD